ncbi:MAG: hypothetical protein IJW86_09115 [Clostridia bacterium]|nr:hypothetical protein [Clostridia bacterium]
MKKIIAIVAALVVVLGVFAACGGEKQSEITPYEGTLEDLTAKLYEIQPVEFMVGPAMQVDFADEYAPSTYLGVESTEGFKEATWSESMIGAQAYSLVLARVSDTAKIEELKNAMFNGINTRKWICVEADQLRVVSSGDIIMLIMVGSELAPGVADGMVEAFKQTVGELSGETLTRG